MVITRDEVDIIQLKTYLHSLFLAKDWDLWSIFLELRLQDLNVVSIYMLEEVCI